MLVFRDGQVWPAMEQAGMARWRQRKPNSLGLAGDGDDVALFQDVERAFGIRILRSEAAQLRTVGRLYDLILAKLPRNSSGHCLTAGAFYRLRAALCRMGDFGRLRPGTDIAVAIGGSSVRRFWHRLEQESGLALPGLFVGRASFLAVLVSTVLLPVALVLAETKAEPAFLLLWLVSIFGFWMALKVLPMQVPTEFGSLGGLSRGVAHENVRILADACRTCRPEDIWKTLDYLLRKETGTGQPIDRETVFFDGHHP